MKQDMLAIEFWICWSKLVSLLKHIQVIPQFFSGNFLVHEHFELFLFHFAAASKEEDISNW